MLFDCKFCLVEREIDDFQLAAITRAEVDGTVNFHRILPVDRLLHELVGDAQIHLVPLDELAQLFPNRGSGFFGGQVDDAEFAAIRRSQVNFALGIDWVRSVDRGVRERVRHAQYERIQWLDLQALGDPYEQRVERLDPVWTLRDQANRIDLQNVRRFDDVLSQRLLGKFSRHVGRAEDRSGAQRHAPDGQETQQSNAASDQ